jgi:hypothetical protein
MDRSSRAVRGRRPSGGLRSAGSTVEPPLYLRLGLEIDALHPAVVVPAEGPVASNGAGWSEAVPPALLSRTVYELTSPAAVWQRLRAEPAIHGLSDQQVVARMIDCTGSRSVACRQELTHTLVIVRLCSGMVRASPI